MQASFFFFLKKVANAVFFFFILHFAVKLLGICFMRFSGSKTNSVSVPRVDPGLADFLS